MNSEKTTELTLLWVLTAGAVAIMLARLIMRRGRLQKFELGDYFTMAAIVSVLLRASVENVAMVWGDNQIPAAHRINHVFSSEELYRREVGAKLTIVNRVFYTFYIWLQKCVVMCIVQHLLRGLEQYLTLRLSWITLAVTFVASFVTCFVECTPFQLYWQVVPDPGTCAAGDLQLLVFSVLEIFTDIILIVLPLRHLVRIRRPWLARLRLILVFMVGTTIIAVTLTRLLMNRLKYHRSGGSHNIANVEIFFAAFVANAPPIYGLLNMKYGSSSQRSRPYNHSGRASKVTSEGRQLDVLTSASTIPQQSMEGRQNLGNQTRGRANMKDTDTDSGSTDELIIMKP